MAETNPAQKARDRYRALPVREDVITRRSYRIYVDDTGLVNWSGQNLFGLAGVAGFGCELLRSQQQWRDMKRDHFGGPDTVIHARRRPRPTEAQQGAISEFFRKSRLKRFAYLIDSPGLRLPGVDALKAMRGFLMDELAQHIADLPKLPDDLAVVFEASDSLAPVIMDTFPGLTFSAEDGSFVRDVTTGFADKTVGCTWLEMADQIAHRAQRQHRQRLPIEDASPEFRAVFPMPRPPHVLLAHSRLAAVEYPNRGVEVQFKEGTAVSFKFSGEEGLKAARRFGLRPGIADRGPMRD